MVGLVNQSEAIEQITKILIRQHIGPGGKAEALRHLSGLPASAIGKHCGVSAETVFAWEAGTVTPTTAEGLRWLATMYEIAPRRPGVG
jgi:DNA-binding transcriptional regulator YiaG